MNYIVKKFCLICLLSFLGGNTIIAQLNLKIGYQAGYTNPSIHNSMTNRFNVDTTYNFLDQKLGKINFLHGVQIGVRYRWEYIGFEFTWYNRYKSLEATGIWPNTENEFNRDLSYRTITYSLGLENYVGNFGWGASIDFDNLSIRTQHSDGARRDKYRIVGEDDNWSPWALSSHFYLMFNLQSTDYMTISFRPYVQYYWQQHDLAPFRDNLIPEAVDITDTQDNFMNFGLMIVFYNGYQDY